MTETGTPKSKKVTKRRRVKIGDNTYSLAIVSKGRNIPDKEKIKIAVAVCDLYSKNENPLLDCLKYCGVNSFKTWHDWRDQIEEIKNLYSESIAIREMKYRHGLRELGQTMAQKLLTGYFVNATEEEGEAVVDDDGNPIEGEYKIRRIKKKQIFVKPHVEVWKAVMFKMDPKSVAIKPDETSADAAPTDIKIEIVNPKAPVTREEDIDEDI